MDSVQKEAMAVAMELKRVLSLRLCNEISDEQYQLHRERLLNDFNILQAGDALPRVGRVISSNSARRATSGVACGL